VFNDSPAAQAKAFRKLAASGCTSSISTARSKPSGQSRSRAGILKEVDVPTQLGGGIRTIESIAQWFEPA